MLLVHSQINHLYFPQKTDNYQFVLIPFTLLRTVDDFIGIKGHEKRSHDKVNCEIIIYSKTELP